MARLPDPILEGTLIRLSDTVQENRNIFYKMLHKAARNRHLNERGETDARNDF